MRNRSNLAACTSCSAPIRWLKTDRAKPIPVDAHTAAEADTLFNVAHGHISHFRTCPNASKHSKRSADREATPKRPRKTPAKDQPDLGLYPPGYPLIITNPRPGTYTRPLTLADSLDHVEPRGPEEPGEVDDFADDLTDPRYPHPERRTTA